MRRSVRPPVCHAVCPPVCHPVCPPDSLSHFCPKNSVCHQQKTLTHCFCDEDKLPRWSSLRTETSVNFPPENSLNLCEIDRQDTVETPWKHTEARLFRSRCTVFCVNLRLLVFKAEMLHSVWITIGWELLSCSFYTSPPVWMGLLMLVVEGANQRAPDSERGARRRCDEAELCLPERKMKPTLSAWPLSWRAGSRAEEREKLWTTTGLTSREQSVRSKKKELRPNQQNQSPCVAAGQLRFWTLVRREGWKLGGLIQEGNCLQVEVLEPVVMMCSNTPKYPVTSCF